MTNNYTIIKDNNSSKKIVAARLKPRRGVEYDLTLDSGNVYQTTFLTDSLCAVEVNGVSYTLTTGTPTAGQYSFSRSTKVLKIYLTSPPLNYQTVNSGIVASYYLHFTNTEGFYYFSDPEDTGSEVFYFEPRIVDVPEFSVTSENIVDGIFTVGNTNISLINNDKYFQQFLTDYDSFSRAEFKSWHCLDDLNNVKKLFFGSIINVNLNDVNVSMSIDNIFAALENTYVSNTTFERSTYRNSLFTVKDEDRDKYILELFCKTSMCEQTKRLTEMAYTPRGFAGNQQYYRFDKVNAAINVNYNANISTANNRTWACCIETSSPSTVSEIIAGKATVSFAGINLYKVSVADATLYLPGDTVVTDFGVTNISNSVVVVDYDNNFIYLNDNSYSNGQTIYRPSISVVQWYVSGTDEGRFILQYGTDYTVTTIDNVRCIELANNFENNYVSASFDQLAGIFPDAILEFRAWNHDDLNHAIVMQELIESVGLTIDLTSFAAAESFKFSVAGPEIFTNFTLPFWGSNDMPAVKEVIEKLLTSTFGYITPNNDFEIEYHNFELPIAPTESIDDNQIIEGTLQQSIDYKDVYSNFRFKNIHNHSLYNHPKLTTRLNISETRTVDKLRAKYYHGIDKTKEIEHIIEDNYNTGIINIIAYVLGERRLTVSFETKGSNFLSIIGDEFIIDSAKVVDLEKNIKILSITKAINKTQVSGIDFLGPIA